MDRRTVWKETIELCQKEPYASVPESIRYVLPIEYTPSDEKHSSFRYHTAENHIESSVIDVQMIPKYDCTEVEIVCQDTLNYALLLKRKGYHPVLLNMANDLKPGGIVENGGETQEEELFRRSNYFKTLDKKYYPLLSASGVYSPDVHVFRLGAEKQYKILKIPQKMSMMAVAALRNPSCYSCTKRFKNTKDVLCTLQKIDLMFRMAYQHGHDSLVLSAWGCGAFCNPPVEIAEWFRRTIWNYIGCFRRISFAIFDRLPGVQGYNYGVFAKTLCPNGGIEKYVKE